jgi:hypothetical protein
VDLFAGHGYRLRAVSAALHLVQMESELGNKEQALRTLSRALEDAASESYSHFHWWDPEVVAFSRDLALREGVAVDYASRLDSIHSNPGWETSSRRPVQEPDAPVDIRTWRGHHPRGFDAAGRDSSGSLAACKDLLVRDSLLRSVSEGLIDLEGIEKLKARHGLSWREIEVFIDYYLAADPDVLNYSALRDASARRLSISSHTVRCHVNSIRGKLGLPRNVSGSRVRLWAQRSGLLPDESLLHLDTSVSDRAA